MAQICRGGPGFENQNGRVVEYVDPEFSKDRLR